MVGGLETWDTWGLNLGGNGSETLFCLEGWAASTVGT